MNDKSSVAVGGVDDGRPLLGQNRLILALLGQHCRDAGLLKRDRSFLTASAASAATRSRPAAAAAAAPATLGLAGLVILVTVVEAVDRGKKTKLVNLVNEEHHSDPNTAGKF